MPIKREVVLVPASSLQSADFVSTSHMVDSLHELAAVKLAWPSASPRMPIAERKRAGRRLAAAVFQGMFFFAVGEHGCPV